MASHKQGRYRSIAHIGVTYSLYFYLPMNLHVTGFLSGVWELNLGFGVRNLGGLRIGIERG